MTAQEQAEQTAKELGALLEKLERAPEIYLVEKIIDGERKMFPASGNIQPTHKAKLVEIQSLS